MRVHVHLVSEKDCNQSSVDVTEDDPDQNYNQILEQSCAVGVPDEEELTGSRGSQRDKQTTQNELRHDYYDKLQK